MKKGWYIVDKISLKEQELVLKVKNNVDPQIWSRYQYSSFLQELVQNRVYQEEAILAALKFMCSGQYQNLEELAKENYQENIHLQEKFSTLSLFLNKLNFKDKYNCNIDLATGTGKSWVLYGIARIMLDANIVDQVLVLVPSLTIERELTQKFKNFASDSRLNETLDSIPPKIINGTESIVKGTICIENRDAIYNNTRSSIIDSLTGKGERTLILSDEAHHIYYTDKNKWKTFIETINFKYILGVSGTCYYKDNDYFTDVIYRYSLKQAIEEQRIKTVEYISEDNVPSKKEEKWQVIIKSHDAIKKSLENSGLLPITIVITETTSGCDKKAEQFKSYLKEYYHMSDTEMSEKVLVIHSKSSTASDRLRLKDVDNNNSKVEWIFSVSMLTEGWDVKRVFQIVPDEERAFNSKLLIAQVLGRGLRVPQHWNGANLGQPKVTIFNHAKWASRVEHLVNEVLEIEKRIATKVIDNSVFHFDLWNIDYKRSANSKALKTKQQGIYHLFENGYIILPTDMENSNIEIKYSNLNHKTRDWSTNIIHKTISVKDMALKMWYRFEDLGDPNLTEQYQKSYPIETLMEVIQTSLEKSGNKVITDKIANRLMSSLNIAWRTGNAYLTYNTIPTEYFTLSTRSLRSESTSASMLKNNHTLFWTDDTIKSLTEEEKVFFHDIKDSGNGYKQTKIENKNCLKTVTSFVFSISEPERKFISKLIHSDHIPFLEAWVKSTSTGFYSIEYAWKKNPNRHGEALRYDKFNPDFFIKTEDNIIVVEIKDDSEITDPSPENIGKYIAAKKHFDILNEYLKSQNRKEVYKFTMLTPKNYEVFFEQLHNHSIQNFNSELDASIDLITK